MALLGRSPPLVKYGVYARPLSVACLSIQGHSSVGRSGYDSARKQKSPRMFATVPKHVSQSRRDGATDRLPLARFHCLYWSSSLCRTRVGGGYCGTFASVAPAPPVADASRASLPGSSTSTGRGVVSTSQRCQSMVWFSQSGLHVEKTPRKPTDAGRRGCGACKAYRVISKDSFAARRDSRSYNPPPFEQTAEAFSLVFLASPGL